MKAVLMLAHPAAGVRQGSSPAVEATFLTSSHWTKGVSLLILGIIHQNCSLLDLWSVRNFFCLFVCFVLFCFVNDYFDIYWKVKWIILLSERWTQMTATSTKRHQGFFLHTLCTLSIRYTQPLLYLLKKRISVLWYWMDSTNEFKIFVVINSNKVM